MPEIETEISGLDRIMKGLKKFPFQIKKNFIQAGHQAAFDVILKTEGLQAYPPETAANMPPAPYYIRGVGTQGASKNYHNSENLGKQWFVKRQEPIGSRIYNRASYAKWMHGEDQAKAMKRIGWKKLFETAKSKLGEIQKVYQAWVNKTIKDLDL
jgi:hypothetical protein